MSLSGTWDARKDHCGFGYEVSTAPYVRSRAPASSSPFFAPPASSLPTIRSASRDAHTRSMCSRIWALCGPRRAPRLRLLAFLTSPGCSVSLFSKIRCRNALLRTHSHLRRWLAQAQWVITEVGSELTAVEQPGAKCCFVMPNCFLKTHTMSRQADGTWAGTCVPVALPPRHSPLPPAPFVACMRRTIAGGRVCARACVRVFRSGPDS